MTTQFCSAEISLAELGPTCSDLVFYIDGNSKITSTNGSYLEPKPNAFSLPHISSCPGSTPSCRAACYVHGLQSNAPDVYRLYALNAMALQRVLMSSSLAWDAAQLLGTWIANNAQGGFRWHVSGDVMSQRHANWITDVCEAAPDVPFWLYTRTLDAVGLLVTSSNLAVNVSADADNYARARDVAREHSARLCYMTRDGSLPDDLPEGSVIFPDYSLRGRALPEPTEHPWWQSLTYEQRKRVCPADFFGQSESIRCSTDRCSKCLVPVPVQLRTVST